MGRRDRLLAFGGLMLAGLMSSLDATVLGTALPAIVGDLGGLGRMAWYAVDTPSSPSGRPPNP
ncbi:hypothetical protein E1287_00205 [Actinomadura sp. KC06]|uniref:hypothetical protein n=1 Tax=Actinomadura sp. KC06 TaxID=2530369 RepID=UPI0010462585|nr:hypothetical protein [Actinomadura sp. KC06]TDD40437.1 hypothetical protein E1287_00205 [Actinomadura sp. KC06]